MNDFWTGKLSISDLDPANRTQLASVNGKQYSYPNEYPKPSEMTPRNLTLGKTVGTDNQEKDEKQRQNDKTGLGMEKTVKDKAKSKPESQSSQKVNNPVKKSIEKSTGQSQSQPKSTPGPKSKK
ncbi:hypothetical protein Tco_1559504, partial [Tanacetum coccineum]